MAGALADGFVQGSAGYARDTVVDGVGGALLWAHADLVISRALGS
ncbi:hypothetical protein [Mycolicibacterium sp. CBMA 234]|nr:hypothetical protein [Mycolicibacterium sp. CBMA 234]